MNRAARGQGSQKLQKDDDPNETEIKDKNEDGKQSDEQSESQIPITKCRRVLNGAHGGVKVSSTMEVSIMAPGPRTGKQREEERGKKRGSFNYGLEAPGYKSALALICNQRQTALFLTTIWTKPELC